MESRKVQAVGTSTLAISLPKKWASEQQIEKGAQVFLVEEGDVLKVMSPSFIEGRKTDKISNYIINVGIIYTGIYSFIFLPIVLFPDPQRGDRQRFEESAS